MPHGFRQAAVSNAGLNTVSTQVWKLVRVGDAVAASTS
jgi:hypothetical protein